MRLTIAMASLALAATISAAPAAASVLLGKTVQQSYLFPTSTSNYEGPYNVIVNGTASSTFFGLVTATPGDTTLTLSFTNPATFTSASFNGVRLFDAANSVASFTGVTLSGANNFGFGASRISFDADNIYLNIQGLSVDSASTVTVNIAVNAVPEPATWVMMIAGFGLVGSAMRRRTAVFA